MNHIYYHNVASDYKIDSVEDAIYYGIAYQYYQIILALNYSIQSNRDIKKDLKTKYHFKYFIKNGRIFFAHCKKDEATIIINRKDIPIMEDIEEYSNFNKVDYRHSCDQDAKSQKEFNQKLLKFAESQRFEYAKNTRIII